EAERCARIALIHDGRIHQVGTPAEIRRSPGLQRLVVRLPMSDLRRAEDALRETPLGAGAQRFGDRLDVLVADAGAGVASLSSALRDADVSVQGIRVASPTLENAFVALLRRDGAGIAPVAFPMRRREGREGRSDVVAIGARSLSKRFVQFDA